MKKIVIGIVLSIFCFTSCKILPTVPSEYTVKYGKPSGINIWELGKGKVLFFNGDYYVTTFSSRNSSRINLKINGKYVPTTNYGEFFMMDLPYGEYEFETEIYGFGKISKVYKITITEKTRVFRLQPNAIGKKVIEVDDLPKEFRRYGYPEEARYKY